MNSIDLYQLTRINDYDLFKKYEKKLSSRQDNTLIRKHEVDGLVCFVSEVLDICSNIDCLRHFYFSFSIPQISKEFDMLRINDEMVIDIELKSNNTGEEQIKMQLIQNKHYLSHLLRPTLLFSFHDSDKKLYQLTSENEIVECDISVLVNTLLEQTECFDGDINTLFKVSDFLASPINSPEKFISRAYFLTSQQQKMKKEILHSISDQQGSFSFFGIDGRHGTGKTLALYDLAYELSYTNPCCIIHCANLSNGHKMLNKTLSNIDIIAIKEFGSIDYTKYAYFFVDETHRIYPYQFKNLIDQIKSLNLVCVFSYDGEQYLSKAEKRNDIISDIIKLPHFNEYRLSKKIRTNKEIASFIKKLLNIRMTDDQHSYPCVSVIFANNNAEAMFFIEQYRSYEYMFIGFTQSSFKKGSYDIYPGDINTHFVVGQEFDNVVMLINQSFYYDDSGHLLAYEHPCPNYIYRQLLFQGLTRTREKLAIIVLENRDVFQNILSILNDG